MTASPPSLLDMPQIVMNRILENSNYRSLMSLRKVCHTLQTFIDDEKPEAGFSEINIRLENLYLELRFQTLPDTENLVRYYINNNIGCRVEHNNKNVFLENIYPHEVIYKDFEFVLKFQKRPLEQFLIYGRDVYKDAVYNEFLTVIGDILKRSGNILKVENFSTDAPRQDQIMKFLPYFDAQFLNRIHFQHTRDAWEVLQMDQIVQLEQWKQCKSAVLQNTMVNPGIEHFLHLTSGAMVFREISAEDLKVFKEAIVNTPAMEAFHIEYHNYGVEWGFGRLLGEPVIFERDEEKRWFFRLPYTTDKVLYVFNDVEHQPYFLFEKSPMTHIQEDVLIYD